MTHVALCRHEKVHFGSGDFYLFCHDCGRTWATINRDGMDRIAPEEANQGAGGQLSGEVRVHQQITQKEQT